MSRQRIYIYFSKVKKVQTFWIFFIHKLPTGKLFCSSQTGSKENLVEEYSRNFGYFFAAKKRMSIDDDIGVRPLGLFYAHFLF